MTITGLCGRCNPPVAYNWSLLAATARGADYWRRSSRTMGGPTTRRCAIPTRIDPKFRSGAGLAYVSGRTMKCIASQTNIPYAAPTMIARGKVIVARSSRSLRSYAIIQTELHPSATEKWSSTPRKADDHPPENAACPRTAYAMPWNSRSTVVRRRIRTNTTTT